MSSIAAFPASTRERLSTPVRDIMRQGVVALPQNSSLLEAKRAMVRHRIHAVLIVASDTGRPLGWVTDRSLLAWLERDLGALRAGQAITEPAHSVEPDSIARVALEALEAPGVTHLLVAPAGGGPPHGVVAALDLVDLVTRP